MSRYETVIGLEVHVHLKTASKVFCACPAVFGEDPNSRVCPVCMGLPGSLPVLNQEALTLSVKTALALGCEISPFSKFDRKNYFYPDLPKNYQISQYDLPIGLGGYLLIRMEDNVSRIGITRVHLEEDAGKLVHCDGRWSGVDFNRCGVPLLEIVTEPDLSSPAQALSFLHSLKTVLLYLDVSDCNMEEGSLRCDANISVRPSGEKALGVKTEVKNMNSFRFVQHALAYEEKRQVAILESGGEIEQETRLWDEDSGETRGMRSKEEAHDYRYFPEPDLPPVVCDEVMIEKLRASLPELPLKRQERFVSQYGLPDYDAGVLTADRHLGDYFEECVKECSDAKLVSNWIMSELLGEANRRNITVDVFPVTPTMLVGLLNLVVSGDISGKIAKEVFAEMAASSKGAQEIVQERQLVQISDEDKLWEIVEKVVSEHPKAVEEYRSGKTAVLKFLVGQMMRETQGQANPRLAGEILEAWLKKE